MKKKYLSSTELKTMNRRMRRDGLLLSLISQNPECVIVVPEGVEYIPKETFAGLEGPLTVRLPASLRKIGKGAFKKCLGLTQIEIPEGVRRIPDHCFADCENLKEVVLPEGLVEIGQYAFECCHSLSIINFPDSLEVIDDWAFRVCNNLDCITISPNVKSIGAGAFQSASIRNLRLGALIEPILIDDVAFFNAPIHSIVVDPESTIYEDAGCNVVIEKETKRVICGSINSIIPDDATTIAGGAFGASPKFLEIPSSVKRIETNAFSGEGSTFIVKEGVEVIEPCAFQPIFWDEDNVVYIPPSVHTIGGQISSVKFHLDMANPFFYFDTEGANIISMDAKLVWGRLLQGIPKDVNEVQAVIDIDPDYSELIVPDGVSLVGSGIFGADFPPFERIVVYKGTKIDIPRDIETGCEIKVIVPTLPSASGIIKTIEYIIPAGTPGEEIRNYLGDDTI